jgi:hypothetical protein
VRLLHCVHERIAEHDDHQYVDKEKVMLKNVGTVDRVICIVAGLALIAASHV